MDLLGGEQGFTATVPLQPGQCCCSFVPKFSPSVALFCFLGGDPPCPHVRRRKKKVWVRGGGGGHEQILSFLFFLVYFLQKNDQACDFI